MYQPHAATLSVITNERGGIIDDCIVTKEDGFIGMVRMVLSALNQLRCWLLFCIILCVYLVQVVNGACKEKDMAHFKYGLLMRCVLCVRPHLRSFGVWPRKHMQQQGKGGYCRPVNTH